MRTIKVKISLILAAGLLTACASKAPQMQVVAAPQGTAVLVADAGQALIYRVEQRGPWQVFATTRSLQSLPDAGVQAVDQLDLEQPLQRTAETLVSQLRARGADVEVAQAPLPNLRANYQHALILAVKRAGVAQARDTQDWPRAVYEISAQLVNLQTGTTLWRSNAEQALDLPLADVVEGVPEAGAETLLRTTHEANADLLANVLARMSPSELATAY
ncbi:hypothetical protein GYB61_03025 [bacterium]|nr:hypothetical protein [bacterium]